MLVFFLRFEQVINFYVSFYYIYASIAIGCIIFLPIGNTNLKNVHDLF